MKGEELQKEHGDYALPDRQLQFEIYQKSGHAKLEPKA